MKTYKDFNDFDFFMKYLEDHFGFLNSQYIYEDNQQNIDEWFEDKDENIDHLSMCDLD